MRSPSFARVVWPLVVGALAWVVAGCSAAFPYRAPAGLSVDSNGAVVMAALVKRGAAHSRAGRVQLDVYSFASGCPDLSSQLTERGYRGSVALGPRTIGKLVLPGDEPVLLKTAWNDASQVCSSVLAFRPRSRATYVYGYAPPARDDGVCGALLKEVVDPGAEDFQTVPVHNVQSVRMRRGFWGGQTPAEDVCRLASIRSDEPGSPSDQPVAGEVPAASSAAPRGPEPSAPAMPDTEPRRRRRISGHSLGVRLGFTAGGDTLATAQASDGSKREVSGGGGGTFALDARVTPLWWLDTIGAGVGAEIGWKGQQISASNGSISLSRFPLLVTAHLMARAGDDSYFVLAGGVEKDLAVSLSGSGAGYVGALDVESAVGGVGSLAYAYAFTRHLVMDGTLRVAILHYNLSTPTGASSRVSASYGGFTLGLQYQF